MLLNLASISAHRRVSPPAKARQLAEQCCLPPRTSLSSDGRRPEIGADGAEVVDRRRGHVFGWTGHRRRNSACDDRRSGANGFPSPWSSRQVHRRAGGRTADRDPRVRVPAEAEALLERAVEIGSGRAERHSQQVRHPHPPRAWYTTTGVGPVLRGHQGSVTAPRPENTVHRRNMDWRGARRAVRRARSRAILSTTSSSKAGIAAMAKRSATRRSSPRRRRAGARNPRPGERIGGLAFWR